VNTDEGGMGRKLGILITLRNLKKLESLRSLGSLEKLRLHAACSDGRNSQSGNTTHQWLKY